MSSGKKEANGEALYLIRENADDILDYSTINSGKDAIFQRSPSFDPANRVTLSWHNIDVYVKPKGRNYCNFRKRSDEQKQLLHNGKGILFWTSRWTA
ncbi:hypothetical protein CEXT_638412 [Caerostris extrusa]|uniref:Uncharacterized protein n=1 Tax=Caerostris extrusa TaxID=172846 RepID=A0AAV4SVL2_CAEEX|nr:hypothetical protein CEXT_638412 [Caerostris extrusa]